MSACKSPSHKRYADAIEDMDWAAGEVARKLHEARSFASSPEPRVSMVERHPAVSSAMDEAMERIVWARQRVADAEAEVNRHFDRGCRNLRRLTA
jgi:hypothetical protein